MQKLTEFPTGETRLIIPGQVGKLEALSSTPPKESKNIVAIICHPHPLFGGTMHNKVVYTIARAFKEMKLRTVRFNFRGVGNSSGTYAEGTGETEDLMVVIQWVKQVRPQDAIWLAGFSFGAYVSARAAGLDSNVSQLVSVAPPVRSFDFSDITMPACHWLVVQGEEDEIVSPEAVYQWVAKLQPSPQLIRIPAAGHFFHNKLIELREALITALHDHTSA